MCTTYTIKNYHDYDNETQKLFDASICVRERAYVPYSKFKVGAALLAKTKTNSTIYTGCNVENASYPLTTCAERSATVKAVSEGDQKFTAVAVCGAFEDNPGFVTPCGGCRQNINEFKEKDGDIVVYLVKPDRSKVLETSINNMLPLSFVF